MFKINGIAVVSPKIKIGITIIKCIVSDCSEVKFNETGLLIAGLQWFLENIKKKLRPAVVWQ